MVSWGPGLFESDQDLGIASDISADADMELTGHEDGDGDSPGLEATVRALDSGLFDRLFSKYKNSSPDYQFYGYKYYVVILVALGMQLGVTISEEQKSYARSIVKSAGLYKEGITQFEEALDKRVNGQLYEFISPDVCETLPTHVRDIQPMHCLAPRYYADNVPTQDMALRMFNIMQNGPKCDGCGKYEKLLGQDHKFRRCTRCKKANYCDRDCQKRGWKTHKKICGHEANQAAVNTAANTAGEHGDPAGDDAFTAVSRRVLTNM